MPRDPNGKLYKRKLRDPYWAGRSAPSRRRAAAHPHSLSGLAAIALAAVAWAALAASFERFVDRVDATELPEVSARAAALHRASEVVDLHADSLLFGRDLARRSRTGHVDLPRLRAGGVALQVFGAATSVPLGMNIERNDPPGIDLIALGFCVRLARGCLGGPPARLAAQAAAARRARRARPRARLGAHGRRPRAAARAARERARRARRAARRRGRARARGRPRTSTARSPLGVRMIGLAHFFDNELRGLGARRRRRADSRRSAGARSRAWRRSGSRSTSRTPRRATIDDVLAIATQPVLVSHGGVKGTCPNARTLSDAQLRGIAATGGVIGIGYWKEAVCGTAPRDVARAIRYAVDLVGDEHVALGSDYDGATTVAFDASQLAVLTQAMLDAGLSEGSVRRVLGENALRVLAATLPPS